MTKSEFRINDEARMMKEGRVRVVVKLFAVAKERAGVAEVVLELAEGATVGGAAEELGRRFEGLGTMMDRVAFAVNRGYARKDTVLREGDELAVIPPVSGG